ncbi:hypothetical protein EV426DRAFT_611631 [Tirmania nivea]|nr:hypothetical protein EV426DRAFT_611631 [Tirmania nivea]
MATLTDLPNELLTHILNYLPSLPLLRLLRLSLHIHTLILHILHRRIHTALTLHNHFLIFECYTPSARTTSPILHCAYVTFTPTSSPRTLPHPPPLPSPSTLIPTTTLSLDAGSPSTPLTAQSALVKTESGLLTSAIEVFDKSIYVHRPWLKRAEERTMELFGAHGELSVHGGTGESPNVGVVEGEVEEEGGGDGDAEDTDKDRILWIGDYGLAGMKLRVREKEPVKQQQEQQPLLMPVDEEPAVTYSLYYEQLMVKTVHLLVTLEMSWEEQLARRGVGGLAMVLGG